MNKIGLGVAATFTAEPLGDALRFWLAEIGVEGEVAFAPYDQVFPSLLDPGSVLGRAGAAVVLVRAEDLVAGDSAAEDLAAGQDGLDQVEAVATDLVAALRTSARASGTPHVLVVCPPSPEHGSPEAHERLASRLARAFEGDRAVSVLTSAEPYEPGPEAVHDAFADRTGNVPYTDRYFAALAAAAARRLHAMTTPRPKVVAVDCDGTLWDGVVGEDGPDGVVIGPQRLEIWRELARQVAAGRLLCLCSKNEEKDVREVFARHPELPVGLDDVAAMRVGWEAKSQSLRSLAAELDLGLDSFVFLDDSPVECAEVRAGCPEVLTLRLPAGAAEAADFLRHCWPLDLTAVTEADRERTRRYQEERQREQARDEMSLADFFATLDLRVTITPAGPEHETRAAQLAERTNQFNLSGARRLDGEEKFVVDVRDRFGDYGVVGLTDVRTEEDTLRAGAFLLSCRALGRGVEHRMLAHLGALARERGLARVALAFRATERNQPARDFLAALPATVEPSGEEAWYVLDAADAAAVVHTPGPAEERAAGPAGTTGPVEPAGWAAVERIATRLTGADAILDAMRAARPVTEVAGASPVEAAVMRMWAELLDVAPTSVSDGFFQLGGHSLRLVQFMARVRAEFGVELPFDTLYTTSFTVSEVAKAIEERQLADADDEELAGLLDELAGLSDEEIDALLDSGNG
ncbi:HAD-IIIC family phosphatase [Microbispora bryophytorum]|uniref:HAD-IIIC family phosphatase n=1 Tax=Microbispora bryophytorum subsp. camponoti TaxID=1677852 RepID=A0ABR8KZU0_9ACTN|nr:HAD-IIIC family phosphatase [Microbispora camponoti]MBD3141759.1 HAD-IIIC family phosphatase [Microbispora camponoti]